MLQLTHHLVVDLQTAGSVDDHDAVSRPTRFVDTVARDAHDVLRVALRVYWDLELLAECLELVDGRRAIDVGGDEAHRASFVLEATGELGGSGRLPRSLQPHHKHDRWRYRAETKPFAPLAKHCRKLVVYDLDELLSGR